MSKSDNGTISRKEQRNRTNSSRMINVNIFRPIFSDFLQLVYLTLFSSFEKRKLSYYSKAREKINKICIDRMKNYTPLQKKILSLQLRYQEVNVMNKKKLDASSISTQIYRRKKCLYSSRSKFSWRIKIRWNITRGNIEYSTHCTHISEEN